MRARYVTFAHTVAAMLEAGISREEAARAGVLGSFRQKLNDDVATRRGLRLLADPNVAALVGERMAHPPTEKVLRCPNDRAPLHNLHARKPDGSLDYRVAFWSCTNYPECRHTLSIAAGNRELSRLRIVEQRYKQP